LQHIDLVKESVTLSTENPRVGGSIPPLGTIHKIAQHKLGFFMYGVQGLDENRRCGSTDCASNQQRAQRAKPAGGKQP